MSISVGSMGWAQTNASDLLQCVGFDAMENKWSGDCEDYFRGAFEAAVPGLLFGALLIVLLAFYILCRCCNLLLFVCRCCKLSHSGGCSRGVAGGYRMLVWAAALSMLALAVASTATNSHLTSVLGSVQDDIKAVRTKTDDAFGSLTGDMRRFTAHAEVHGDETMARATDAAATFADWTKKMKDIEQSLTGYQWTVLVVLWLTTASLFAFAFCARANIRFVAPVLAVATLFVFGLLVCALQTVAGLSYEFVHDGCDQRDALQGNLDSFFDSPRYTDVSAVRTLQTLPGNLVHLLDDNIMVSENTTAATLCSSSFSCPTAATSAAEFLNETMLVDGAARGNCSGKCTILQCATLCAKGSAAQTMSAVVADIFESGTAAAADATELASEYTTAVVFRQGISAAFNTACDTHDVADAAHALLIVLGIACFFATAGLGLAGLGSYIYEREGDEAVLLNEVQPNYGYSTGKPQAGKDTTVY